MQKTTLIFINNRRPSYANGTNTKNIFHTMKKKLYASAAFKNNTPKFSYNSLAAKFGDTLLSPKQIGFRTPKKKYQSQKTLIPYAKKLYYFLPPTILHKQLYNKNRFHKNHHHTFAGLYKMSHLFHTWGNYFKLQKKKYYKRSWFLKIKGDLKNELKNENYVLSPFFFKEHIRTQAFWMFISTATYKCFLKTRKFNRKFFDYRMGHRLQMVRRKIMRQTVVKKQLTISKKEKPKTKSLTNPKNPISLQPQIQKESFKNLTITIKRTINNLFITAFNKGFVIANCSAGKAGFPGPKKLGFYTAKQIARQLAFAIHNFAKKKKFKLLRKNYKPFTLILKSPLSDFMVKSAIFSLRKNKIFIKKILHYVATPHNGSQVRKSKRK